MRRAVLLALLLVLGCSATAGGQGEGALRGRIDAGKARERSLASAADRLGRLERAAARDVAVLEVRVAAVERDLALAQARARQAAAASAAARARVRRLERRLGEVRAKLAALLVSRYKTGRPDVLTVVLRADGFPAFLETLVLLRRVQRADTRLLGVVRAARADALRERAALAVQARRRAEAARAVVGRRAALAAILAGVRARRAAATRARAARLAALQRTQAGRRRAQRALARLLAERARAAASVAGPGGAWAIPWAVVQCESGGQNLPPNGAGASGYYQFLPRTWAALGGSTRHAYQAPKAEQDRLAARLWAGGAGAGNWVCAALAED